MINPLRNRKLQILLFVLGLWLILFSRYGLRNAVPASDGPLSDMLLMMLPQRAFEDLVSGNGGRPMWNPLNGLGNDESTTLWFHPLYPTTCLTRFLGLGLGVSIEIFAHILLAFFGMFFYLRSIGRRYFSSLFGAVSFGYAGMVCAYCFAPPLLMSVAWLPAMAYAAERLLKDRDLFSGALLGLIAGLHLLEGMVQYSLYFAIFFAAYLPFRLVRRKPAGHQWARFLGLLCISGVIALLIGMGKTLPWAVNLERMRGGYGAYAYFAERLFSLRTLITIVAPGIFDAIDGLKQVDLRSYFGIIPLSAALVGVVVRKKNPIVLFFLIVAAVSVALTTDWALVRWLWGASNFFASMTPTRLWVLGVFALSVLGAYGMEWLGEKANSNVHPGKRLVTVTIAVVIIAGMLALVVVLRGGAEALSAKKTLASGAVVLVSILIAGAAFFVKGNASFVTILIIAASINGAWVFWITNPAKHLDAVYASTPITRVLSNTQGRVLRVGRPYSFINGDRVYAARALESSETHDIHGLALMVDRNLDEAFENVFGPPKKGSLMYYRRTRIEPVSTIGSEHELFLDRLGVRYLLVNGDLPDRKPVATDGPFALYDRGDISYPFRLAGDPKAKLGQWSWAKDYNSIYVEIDTKEKATLDFSQSYRKEWSAKIDGNEVSTRTKDGLEIIIDVPAGNHKVVFEFRASYVVIADRITMAGYGIATLLILSGLFLKRRNNRAA